MSPALRLSRTPDHPTRSGSIALRDAGVSARAHAYSGVAGMALVVVPDGSAVPMPQQFHVWSRTLADRGFTSMRTGALSPRQAVQAERAGLRCVQELALLEVMLSTRTAPASGSPESVTAKGRRTQRLRHRNITDIADIDRAAFGPSWWLDAGMLDDVRSATPVYRARVVRHASTRSNGNSIAGFLISGRAGRTGYVQRLAVHPDAHRRGIATDLLLDSLRWMRRARLQRAFVNTHVDNVAALTLYRAHGFIELPERLRVFEGPTPL
jgi:ribosomal protein S18 acetylase RimI-like enzyme